MERLFDVFGTLYRFDELIRWGGYAVLVVIVFSETGLLAGFFLPGDSLLVTAGLLATTPALNIWLLIVMLSAAAIAGDSAGYAIGYHLGPRLFRRENSWLFHKDHVARTQRFYDKYGPKTIVLARFVPIVRTFAPTLAGVGKMRYRTFLLFNIAGGVGWVAGMTLAGYGLGRLIPDIERKLHWVIAIVIGLSLLPIVHEWWQARRAGVSRARV
ncbi:MAG: VTT domain-containing protein [Candidatus Omnitrophica bacterium]|nr:VTT domain-containing protein [Candidatus Omnitrophota bacterium]